MATNFRSSGIEELGDMPWGTHFCLFYETREDLLDILVPYFDEGLRNREFCFCVASEPVIAEEVARALREAVPNFEQYLSEGHIEIISHLDWYLNGGHFDPLKVRQGWLDKLEQALAKGYAGMRFAANVAWLEKQDWDRFAEYEGKLDDVFRNSQIIGVCAYSLEHCLAVGTLDVIRHHQFTLARRAGVWEPLEGVQLKQAHEEVLNLNKKLERRVVERTAELESVNEQLRGEVLDHKRSEEALRQSESNFRALADKSLQGIVIYQNQKIVYVNPAHSAIVGYSIEELKSMSLEQIILITHPLDREMAFERARKRMAGEQLSPSFELRIVRKDGVTRWIQTFNNHIEYYGRPAILSTTMDITERKQAEEALRESEELYRFLAENTNDILTLYNLDQNRVYVSPSLTRVLGWLPDVSFGGIHPGDLQAAKEIWQQIVAGEKTVFTYRHAHADGSWRWLEAWGSLVHYQGQPHVIAVTRDITEREQAEQEIRRYATRMEALAEISRTFVEAGLDYQGILNTVARRTAELIGDSCVITLFSDDQQRSFPVAFHHPNPRARAMMHEALLHIWQGGTDTQRFRTLLDGNSIYIPSINPEEFQASLEPEFWTYFEAIGISSMLIVPLKAQGRVIGTLGITRDHQRDPYTRDDQILLQSIADRAAMSIQNARLFEQVESAREQLEALYRRLLEVQEAERRALTTELHDRVGQSLTGLSILLQNIKALLPDETAQRLMTKFDDAQTLVEDTTRQIRDIMAELYLPELEDYGLAPALEIYAERAASRGNLELSAKLPDLATPRLPSDVRIALFRAAQEAISNVLKHANASQLEVSLQGENGRIRLKVEDDGQGFDPNAASQKEAPSWGLKIMRERIESLGGKVQIESKPGKGTRVTFEIERPA